MGMRVGARGDSFVAVSYDFEYSTEEGNRVWMKEGEVLLLLAKTNNDWWQVIRRGDRRPFYAPARYVTEVATDLEWDAAFSGDTLHYRSDNGEPLPTRLDAFQDKKGHFSTFLGSANKRASYAPPSSLQGPTSADFLFGSPRFQERYRSNSMDSLLVADLNRHAFAGGRQPLVNVGVGRVTQHPPAPPGPLHHLQHHLLQPSFPPSALEKRPTFDNIDKRASWSQDKGMMLPGGPGSQFFSGPVNSNRNFHNLYTNSRAHNQQQQTQQLIHSGAPIIMPSGHHPSQYHTHHPLAGAPSKKPMPLPRSKIPLPAPGMGIQHQMQHSKAATLDVRGHPSQSQSSGYPMGHLHHHHQVGLPIVGHEASSGMGGGNPGGHRQPELKTFKRSKTDLNLGMLNAYKKSSGARSVKGGSKAAVGLDSHLSGGRNSSRSGSDTDSRSNSLTGTGSRSTFDAGGGGRKPSGPSYDSSSINSKSGGRGSGSMSKHDRGGDAGSASNGLNIPAAIRENEDGRGRNGEHLPATSGSDKPTEGRGGKNVPERFLKKFRSNKKSDSKDGDPKHDKPAIKEKPSVQAAGLAFKAGQPSQASKEHQILRIQSESDLLARLQAEREDRDYDPSHNTRPTLQSFAPSAPTTATTTTTSSSVNSNGDKEPYIARATVDEEDSDQQLKISLKVSHPQHEQDQLPHQHHHPLRSSESKENLNPTDKKSLEDKKKVKRSTEDDCEDKVTGSSTEVKSEAGTQSRKASEARINKFRSPKETNGQFLDMMDSLLPESPTPKTASSGSVPTSGMAQTVVSSTLPITIPTSSDSSQSQPLIISTERICAGGTGPLGNSNKAIDVKSNCSSSFDSLDGSLDSAGWPEGGDWLGSEPAPTNHGSVASGGGNNYLMGGGRTTGGVKSPTGSSTCSRIPGSPLPGSVPVRRDVMTDWDEYLDTSGRKFYYNAKTHEKSFKPPRHRTRGSSEGYSAPTSPDPFNDQNADSAFEMSPGISESESKSAEEDNNQMETSDFASSFGGRLTSSDGLRLASGDSEASTHQLSDDNSSRSHDLKSQHRFSHDSSSSTLNSAKTSHTLTSGGGLDSGNEAAASVEAGGHESQDEDEDILEDEDSGDGGLDEEDGPPSGYEVRTDADSGEKFFVNVFTGVAWYSAEDQNGRTYYYEENGNESCWELPRVAQTIQDHSVNSSPVPPSDSDPSSSSTTTLGRSTGGGSSQFGQQQPLPSLATILHSISTSSVATDADSMIATTAMSAAAMSKTESLRQKFYTGGSGASLSGPGSTAMNFQIGDVSIVVIKQGSLHKTKLEERGKKYRKNWCVSNIVLTDTFLLFYKDSKAFANLQQQSASGNGAGSGSNSTAAANNSYLKPDHVIDLKGATVEWCNSDKSKRSNVFEVCTVLDQRMLLQDDDYSVASDWFVKIEAVIQSLTVGRSLTTAASRQQSNASDRYDNTPESATSTLQSNSSSKVAGKGGKTGSVARNKSLKLKLMPSNSSGGGGGDDVSGFEGPPSAGGAAPSTATTPESPLVVNVPFVKEKSRIREKLRRFFLRRPGVEDLMKRGIMKNEPVFGTTLALLARTDQTEVPHFVKKCISVIESKTEYLATDGVYRQSGNLSIVQRLRLQVDHGNTAVLDTVDDVHVLTGALKLFFRELKEPLIPWDSVERLMGVCQLPSRKAKIKGLKEVVARLPSAHKSTLITLLRHLEKVTQYKEVNRMAVSNLAIVFGPTLMWPPPTTHLTNSTNMALNMMQQNMIVEALLTHLNHIVV